MVAIRIRCPACKHPLTVPEEYYNRTVKCPICAHKFRPSFVRDGGGGRVSRGLTVTPPALQKPTATRIFGGGAGAAARRRALISTIRRQRRERDALSSELDRAGKIQLNLLPGRLPRIRGFDIRVAYRSAKEVGGDYYDFIPIDRDNLGMVVADVSGKGFPGAIVMASARAALRLLAKGRPNAKDTIIRLNRFISEDVKGTGMFVTMLYMVLNMKTLTIQVVNAGHNPLILWRDGATRLVNPKGIAVGLSGGEVFANRLEEDLIQLQPGDRLVAYTDGVVEAMNERREEFGEERFVELVEKYAERTSAEFVNQLMHALERHQGRAGQHDDITVVTVKYG